MAKKKSKKKKINKDKNKKTTTLKKKSKATSKKVKKVEKSKKKLSKKKRASKGYARGNLGEAIFELFDRVGIKKVTFAQALKVAKKAKPDTTYGKSYFSWHKNHYRNVNDL